MISFEPLYNLLMERGIPVRDFALQINLNLTYILSGKISPTTASIEKICNALHCDIKDVICWTDSSLPFNAPLKIDYERFARVLREHGFSLYAASIAMNKKANFFSEKKRYGSVIRKNDLIAYCKVWNIDPKEFYDEIQ